MKKQGLRFRWKVAQMAEWRWWANYLKKKDPAAYLQWKKSYWLDFLQRCGVKLTTGAECLDAGCGPAGVFMVLEQQHCDAVDPLLKQYQQELGAFFNPEFYPQVKFHSSPIESFEQEQQYDFVFCLNAINHVSDWRACLDKLWHWTKAGGSLVLSTDVHRYQWLKPIFRALPGDVLHPQQHSLTDYLSVLEAYQPESLKMTLVKRELIFDYYAIVIQKPL